MDLLLATYRCVDPEYVLTVNRIQLFRQVVKELPDLSQFFFDNLVLHSRRPGPSRLLVNALYSLGWFRVGDGAFVDDVGRVFHVCLTPFDHVKDLLLSSWTWTDKVAGQVRHRKYLTELPNICVPLSRAFQHLLPSEKGLLLQQQVGAFFPRECVKHADPQAQACRFCGLPDTRMHRLRHCVKSSQRPSHSL